MQIEFKSPSSLQLIVYYGPIKDKAFLINVLVCEFDDVVVVGSIPGIGQCVLALCENGQYTVLNEKY